MLSRNKNYLDEWVTRLTTLKQDRCYQKGSLIKDWHVSSVDFSGQLLYDLRNKIQSVKLIDARTDESDKSLGLLCKTDDSIILITKEDEKVVFQSLGDKSLVHTRMIHSQNG